MAAKGGGTKKVCLPYAKYKSLSKADKDKLIRSKKSAASKGERVRSRKTFLKVELFTMFNKFADNLVGLQFPLILPTIAFCCVYMHLELLINLAPKLFAMAQIKPEISTISNESS